MISIFIIIIIFIILFYILYKILKSILKAIISLTIIIIILTAVLGFFVYKDIQNLKENVNSPIIILLQDKEYLAGFTIERGKITFVPEETIKEYNREELKEIIASNFKIIIISLQLIEEIPIEIIHFDLLNKDLTKQELVSTLKSGEPIDHVLLNIFKFQPEQVNVVKNTVFSSDIKDNAQFKAALTLLTVQNLIENKETEYLLNSYKNNELRIYKETITFKLFKLIPNSIILSAIEKIQT